MRELTYREALREALSEEMERDSSVFLLGEDIGEFGGMQKLTKGLIDKFGRDRVRNTPIAEAAIVGASVGASLLGMRPVAEIMRIDWSLIAAEQICNQAAKIRYMTAGTMKVPLVVRIPFGASVGHGPHHSQSLEVLYAHMPGLTVVMPSNPYDAKGLLKSSIREDNPVIFIEHDMLYDIVGMVPEDDYLVPLGKAEVKSQGNDITVIAYSRMVNLALKAAEELKKDGIGLEVIDLRTLRPLDDDLILSSVKKTSRVIIVHQACKTGGFGAEIAAVIAEKALDSLDAPIKRVAALDSPVPFSPRLQARVIPNEHDIIVAASELMGKESI